MYYFKRWPHGKEEIGAPKSICVYYCILLLSHFSCVRLCVTPWTAAHQAPSSVRFSRQEYWSGLPFPFPMHESEKWKWSCSVMPNFVTPWTAAYQAPPSMGFSRQSIRVLFCIKLTKLRYEAWRTENSFPEERTADNKSLLCYLWSKCAIFPFSFFL